MRVRIEYLEQRRLLSAGSPDLSFGTGGRTVTPFIGSGQDAAFCTAVQPDGKVLTAGTTWGAVHRFAVVRYNPDGTVDTSFGNAGQVAVTVEQDSDAWAMALQPDGQIILAGEATSDYGSPSVHTDFAAVRMNSDGTLDPSFGNGGMVTVHFNAGANVVNAVAIQPDGKIVLAGDSGDYGTNGYTGHIALTRLNSDGTLDNSFGTAGTLTTTISPNGSDSASGVLVDPAGKVVIAGATGSNPIHSLLVRYNPDGSLDSTFGKGGDVVTPVSSVYDIFHSVALTPDGKIVAAGTALRTGQNENISVARYNDDGTLDTSFDADGFLTIDYGRQNDYGDAVSVMADGRIVVAGYTAPPFTTHDMTFLVRLNSDGSFDTSFNQTGAAVMIGGELAAESVADDGTVTAAGVGTTGPPSGGSSDFLTCRFNPDGTFDTTFNGTGMVSSDFLGPTFSRAQAVALQPDGKIVAAGYTDTGEGHFNDWAVVRDNADGSPDLTFGSNGAVVTDFFGLDDKVSAVAVDGNGDILAAGYAFAQSGTTRYAQIAVVRYLPDGTPDPSFGNAGTVFIPPFGQNVVSVEATSMALQPDGGIVIAGFGTNASGTNIGPAVVRLMPSGSLDPSFAGVGEVFTPISTSGSAQSVAVDAAGRIVVGGIASAFGTDEFLVARYTAAGGMDTSFGGSGMVKTSFPQSADAGPLALQPDGKVLLAGTDILGDTLLARYNPDGSLDSTFGTRGEVVTATGLGAQAVQDLLDGSILVAANTRTGVALEHYTSTGSLDSGFGTAGVAVSNFGDLYAAATSMVLRNNGDIVVAGADQPSSLTETSIMVAQFHGIPPLRVTAATYLYQTLPHALSFTFSEGVSANLSLSSLQVQDLTTGNRVSPVQLTYDRSTNTATFSFSSKLPDGSYQATLLAAGLTDDVGNLLAGDGTPGHDYIYQYFFLTGDANHDGKVDFTDLVTLARNYGKSGAAYADGDLDYDGKVDFQDLVILARHYGQSVPTAAALTPTVTDNLLTLPLRRRKR